MKMTQSYSSEGHEVVLASDGFILTPAAARVLLRIMRKAAARSADEVGSDGKADRLAS